MKPYPKTWTIFFGRPLLRQVPAVGARVQTQTGSSRRRLSSFAQFGKTLSTVDVSKVTNAQKNLMIWEAAEKPDYVVGTGDLLDISRKPQDLSTVLVSAQFLQKVLPPMLAKRIKDLQALPLPFQENGGSIGRMCELFEETFLYILHSKAATNKELEAEFSSLLLMAKAKHLEMGQNISEALINIRCSGDGSWVDSSGNLLYVDDSRNGGQVQEILKRFYYGRIGIRLLVDTHLALRRDVLGDTPQQKEKEKQDVELGHGPLSQTDYQRYVWTRLLEIEASKNGAGKTPRKYYSVMHPRCKVFELIKLAVKDAKVASSRDVTEACGAFMADEIQVEYEGDTDLELPMVPEHLYLVTTEIIANALRANAERHGPSLRSNSTIPPVRVIMSKGPSQFYLKISDQGGGLAFENTDKIWKFSYSASHFRYQGISAAGDVSLSAVNLNRVSRQGLPLSRLYAQYWGGDVTVCSMENWGCDFLLRIPLENKPGTQLLIPDTRHDDPLNRGGCVSEKCSYPFAFWKHEEIGTGTSGSSLFTAPLH